MFGMYPPPNQQPYIDPMIMAKLYHKELKKAQKQAREEEAAKHKDKVSPKKSRWEKMDIFHMGLVMFTAMMFLGPFIGLAYVNMLINYAKAISSLIK